VHRQVLPSIVQTEEMKAMLKVFSVLLLFSVCNRGMINFFLIYIAWRKALSSRNSFPKLEFILLCPYGHIFHYVSR
jgi:hypothetical protein